MATNSCSEKPNAFAIIRQIMQQQMSVVTECYYNVFCDFIKQTLGFDSEKLEISTLYRNCFREIKKHIKHDDTVSRENLMKAIALELVGKSWPIDSDTPEVKHEFETLIAKYKLKPEKICL